MRLLLAVGLLLLINVVGATTATAAWLCEGEPLTVERISGAVDPRGLVQELPNQLDGTLPGDGILLYWRGITLQLPRTNNAGAPSYTDGRWWWREEDADHPEFFERRGEITRIPATQLDALF